MSQFANAKTFVYGYTVTGEPIIYFRFAKINTQPSPRQTMSVMFMCERLTDLMCAGVEWVLSTTARICGHFDHALIPQDASLSRRLHWPTADQLGIDPGCPAGVAKSAGFLPGA